MPTHSLPDLRLCSDEEQEHLFGKLSNIWFEEDGQWEIPTRHSRV
jgi:hypothetical protein